MKISKESNQYPVFEPDEIVVTENQIFAKQLKVLLKQQIQIKTSFERNYIALINVSPVFPLYKFRDTLYIRNGHTYFGIKESKLKDYVESR